MLRNCTQNPEQAIYLFLLISAIEDCVPYFTELGLKSVPPEEIKSIVINEVKGACSSGACGSRVSSNGACSSGASSGGLEVVGLAVVGLAVVGLAVMGLAVVGLAVVG